MSRQELEARSCERKAPLRRFLAGSLPVSMVCCAVVPVRRMKIARFACAQVAIVVVEVVLRDQGVGLLGLGCLASYACMSSIPLSSNSIPIKA